MITLQRFLLLLLPKRLRAAAEQESKDWKAVCAACGHARSVWDLGGVRWKGKGRPTTRVRCPACQVRGLHRIEKRLSA